MTTRLIRAIQKNKIQSVMKILKEDQDDANEPDENESTPLMYACESGNIAIASMLLSVGSDINAVNLDGMTALMYACESGNIQLVEYLIKNQADIRNSLNIAAQSNFEEIVRLLYSYGADAHTPNHSGYTPLMHACVNDNLELTLFFLSLGADPNAESNTFHYTSLFFAVERRNASLINILINSGANVNHQTIMGDTVLMLASSRGDFYTVNVLLKIPGIDIDIQRDTHENALLLACEYKHENITRVLLEMGAQPTRSIIQKCRSKKFKTILKNVSVFIENGNLPNINTHDIRFWIQISKRYGKTKIYNKLVGYYKDLLFDSGLTDTNVINMILKM